MFVHFQKQQHVKETVLQTISFFSQHEGPSTEQAFDRINGWQRGVLAQEKLLAYLVVSRCHFEIVFLGSLSVIVAKIKEVRRRYLGEVGKFYRTLWLIYPRHRVSISIKIGQLL